MSRLLQRTHLSILTHGSFDEPPLSTFLKQHFKDLCLHLMWGIGMWNYKKEGRQFEASPVKLSSPPGLTALIQTEQYVIAAVGDEACLSCQLLKSKEILQITWQKVLPDGEENVATINKYFGQRVNADFQGKVEVKNNGLRNCSIVFKNVTEQDEGCYRCVFNAYPDGALIGNTCLKVYSKNLYACITKCVEVNHLCSIWKCI